MLWHAGEQLRLTVSGFNPIAFHLPGIPGPVTRNKGYHIIHTGGKHDSHLLVPVTPS
jgi:predicted acyl esterase